MKSVISQWTIDYKSGHFYRRLQNIVTNEGGCCGGVIKTKQTTEKQETKQKTDGKERKSFH